MAAESEEQSTVTTIVSRPMKCCPECAQRYSSDSMFCPFDGTPLEETVWVAPTDPTIDPLLGVVVDGRYRVERVLGEGGTGTVYEVVHQTLRRPFAMKVLRRDVARDPALASRFIQEARAAASLKHPHVVSISDFGHLPDQTPYFIMERLTGQTLAQVCKKDCPLPLDRAIRIVLQVADALGAAHEAGIVHRDLKPENLFLISQPGAGDGGTDDVRVVDFGAAMIAGATRITKTGIVFGTPHYMSPEQASGQPVDHRADIYALGVIMYELFTGRLPFEADTLMGVLTKHMFQEPPPFAEARVSRSLDEEGSRLLAALEGVTLRAMAKKPEQRIQNMSALAEELARTVSFDATGRASLAGDWKPQSRRKQPPAIVDLPRSMEGADRADVYPSGDVPVIPRTSLRGSVLVGLGLVLLAVVTAVALVRPASPDGAMASGRAVPSAGSPATAPSSPAPAGSVSASVHLTTVPPFAEVWQNGQRIGTSPLDIPIDPTGAPTRCTLRAPGYAERALVVDQTSTATMQVTLEQVAPATTASQPRRPPPPPRRPHRPSDGELVDPFSR